MLLKYVIKNISDHKDEIWFIILVDTDINKLYIVECAINKFFGRTHYSCYCSFGDINTLFNQINNTIHIKYMFELPEIIDYIDYYYDNDNDNVNMEMCSNEFEFFKDNIYGTQFGDI